MTTVNCDREVKYELLPESPGYLIGDDGSLWSCRQRFTKDRIIFREDWKELKLCPNRDGYLHFVVNVPGTNKTVHQNIYPHRLVLILFNRAPVDGEEACHNDGDKTNNRIENLRWGSRQDNMDDQVMHGKTTRGERSAVARLNDISVAEIRTKYGDGDTSYCRLGREYGVSKGTIQAVVERKTWRHVA